MVLNFNLNYQLFKFHSAFLFISNSYTYKFQCPSIVGPHWHGMKALWYFAGPSEVWGPHERTQWRKNSLSYSLKNSYSLLLSYLLSYSLLRTLLILWRTLYLILQAREKCEDLMKELNGHLVQRQHLGKDVKKLQEERNTVMAEYTLVMGERDQVGATGNC